MDDDDKPVQPLILDGVYYERYQKGVLHTDFHYIITSLNVSLKHRVWTGYRPPFSSADPSLSDVS